jgi:hypothetical protein
MDGNRSSILSDKFHAWLGPVPAPVLPSEGVWVVGLSAPAAEPLTAAKF